MKLLLLSLTLLLLLLLSTTTSTSTSSSSPAAVHDTDGRLLRRGQKYNILPVLRGRGGGLTLAQRNTTMCPPFVAQSLSELSTGLPVTFSPADPKSKLIALSADVNVAFAAATICVQSTAWRLAEGDLVGGRRFVSIGGVVGNPGLSTVSSWFRIEKFSDNDDDDSYKLVFCPGVCKFCKVVCGDLGVVVDDDGKRWLVMGADLPFPVMFKRTQS